ncbi:hypothetical protein HF072_12810 [Bacillus sp. RO3]|nr:hypothetical protein [Bacillus sp. RO3]
MSFDVYNCEKCNRAFAVEKNEDPKVCTYCESTLWEYSHTIKVVED